MLGSNGAHGCSEIDQKWFLFTFRNLSALLGSVSVLDFFAVSALLKLARALVLLATENKGTC
jgi:hypothetical protein